MGIDFKVNFKTKIKINGKEYASVSEVPEEFRQKVADAMSAATGDTAHSKITVNGVGYDSPEDMPPDARRLYEEALSKAQAKARETGMHLPLPGHAAPKTEGALSARTIAIIAALLGLFLLIKYFVPK